MHGRFRPLGEIWWAVVAAHVRPCAGGGATLVVSADHPAWATQMRHLAPDILARWLRGVRGRRRPRRLEVRVRRLDARGLRHGL